MDKDTIEGKWEEMKGKIKEQWSKITDDDLLQSKGSFQEVLGILQKKYGEQKERIADDLKQFFEKNGWK